MLRENDIRNSSRGDKWESHWRRERHFVLGERRRKNLILLEGSQLYRLSLEGPV